MNTLDEDSRDARFRQEVRRFIAENLPADMARRNSHGYHASRADTKAWTRILHEKKGWSVPGWPEELGGPGWSLMQQFIFDDECTRAGAPLLDIFGLKLVGPVIYTFGSADLVERFLVPFRRGEISWAQGFSEPNAGSDLGSLSTRATRDGDHYVIDGRKIWTSGAHQADYIFCLVRTGGPGSGGLSMILVDARSPGITIRPIIDISKSHSLNEVFFDGVRVPAANLIGEENKGWKYARFLLENERAFAAEIPLNSKNLRTLKTLAAETRQNGRSLADDPAFAARIAELEVELAALEYMTLRALSGIDEGRLPVGSILKVRGSELCQRIGEMLVEVLGDYGAYLYSEARFLAGEPQLAPGPDLAPGLWAEAMYRRASSIYGGANEIQRTLIAKQYLEL
ncbi:MAG: acyl-CoA dehydrogenase family protein [Rhodocyclaceae bacterium]|jgi:alkylation response protein AidB-like acyl-CoA dehydrogenase|nr:acyl-CoA dehydrogenase family protein [Rhodocyclaceae bacterium]